MKIVSILTDLIAALTLTAYLGAALLPCEPPALLVGEMARSTSSHVLASPSGHAVSEASAHAGLASHAGQPSHVAEPSHAMQATHAHAHAHENPHARERAPTNAAPVKSGVARIELVAKCLCGCSETRAFVGGGAARLGAVVPGVFVARMPEAIDPVPLDRTVLRRLRIDHEIDPIPI